MSEEMLLGESGENDVLLTFADRQRHLKWVHGSVFSKVKSEGKRWIYSTTVLIQTKTWGCVQEDSMFAQPADTTDVIHHRETSQ